MADLFTSDPPPWRVVLGPDDLPKFRVHKGRPLTPNMPTKNRYKLVNPHTGFLTTRATIRKGLVKAIHAASWEATGKPPPVFLCAVELHLVQYAEALRRTGPAAGLPYLDADACLEPVRDALQEAGVVPDDALIVRNVCESRYRKGEPGLEIEIRPL